MRGHLEDCPACSTWDHRVRRSLLVARNHLRTIEPSEDFGQRLATRLAAERQQAAWANVVRREPVLRWPKVAIAAVVVTVIGAATMSLTHANQSTIATLPVVTTSPTLDQLHPGFPDAKPAFLASMSSGMAILPALLLAEEVPVVRASNEGGDLLRTAGLSYSTSAPH
jgi:hypothetical protein